jgi:hypothetical protein
MMTRYCSRRPRRGREDNIRMDLKEMGVSRKNLPKDRDCWSLCEYGIKLSGSINHEVRWLVKSI